MDNRKLDTASVLALGILDRLAPVSQCPDKETLADVTWDWNTDTLRAGLETGGLTASMYYGCWKVWKTAVGFSGELMQYCAVTDKFADVSLDDALEKAEEWASNCDG